ncbi:MAG: glycerol-3-phosphate dehydrogenase [Hyphomicrobiaceae bacterium]|nr:glycerol-3-phosphate dehydrogenase [Hyphomicrobiaceae bacterium]
MAYDLIIIGGGINGTGIARDAAGRGLKVLLLEKGDLGGATSSASTKLVHGGLRYLEHYKFGLVRGALGEREVLMRIAPHLVRPLRFVLPHRRGMRPKWMLRAGLFLYDTLAPRKVLPASRRIDLKTSAEGAPLVDEIHSGFVYSDCAVDDSRLVVLNARDAADRGADIRPRTEATNIRRGANSWVVEAKTGQGPVTFEGAVLVNAAGAFVDEVLDLATGAHAPLVRLVKGSHIVVRRRFGHDACYTFQNADGRIVFVIPYEGRFSLIGTTDIDMGRQPVAPSVTSDEIAYMLDAVNAYFAEPLTEGDVVHAYTGVRALYDDGAGSAKDVTREYELRLDTEAAPLLSVYGGKITTFRRLAEDVMARLGPLLPAAARPDWTAIAPLPGGDVPRQGLAAFAEGLKTKHRRIDDALIARLVRAYGTRSGHILADAETSADLGEDFGGGLSVAEVDYLMDQEWAETAEDVLWRRSKLGLVLDASAAERIDAHMAARRSRRPAAAE